MGTGNGSDFIGTVKIEDRYSNLFNKPADGAFGEALISQLSPAFQLDGLYGVTDQPFEFRINHGNNGVASSSSEGLMTVASAPDAGSFATLRSNRSLRYRPGQGSLCRITAMFPNGFTRGYQQIAGFLNQSDILGVGFNFGDTTVSQTKREEFAILRRQNSKAEVAQFTITNPAGPGGENVNVILNNVSFPVTFPAGVGTTLEEAVAFLGNQNYGNSWIVDYYDNQIFFLFNGPPQNLTGLFQITSDGQLTATYTELQAGEAPNDNWTYQSDFNIDKLDGTGHSKMTIDPTRLNVFCIDFRWLGAGRIRYSIEDPETGCIFPFHIESYSNQNRVPHISNPSMRIGYGVVNQRPDLGTGQGVVVQGASMMGAIEGKVVRNTTTRAVSRDIAGNLAPNQEHHILSLKNNRIILEGKPNVLNQRELIITSISASINGGNNTDPIKIILYKNAKFDSDLVFSSINTFGAFSRSDAIVDPNLNQNDNVIGTFYVSPDQATTIDLLELRVILVPTDIVSIVTFCPQETRGTGVSINFVVE